MTQTAAPIVGAPRTETKTGALAVQLMSSDSSYFAGADRSLSDAPINAAGVVALPMSIVAPLSYALEMEMEVYQMTAPAGMTTGLDVLPIVTAKRVSAQMADTPGTPMDPVGPTGPVGPGLPAFPVGPVGPVGPLP